ncbi:MAG: hypothetical protein AVDCRST_MAG11-4058, partial [uncultured Gemmatimonadaceae bacterium]
CNRFRTDSVGCARTSARSTAPTPSCCRSASGTRRPKRCSTSAATRATPRSTSRSRRSAAATASSRRTC